MKFKNRELLPCFFIFTSFFGLYLLTLSHCLSASHDSIWYINDIDSAIWIFHPHHLLYHPAAIIWLHFFHSIGIFYDSSLIVAGLNSLFGALTISVIYYILKVRFANTTVAALSTTILIGCSYGFWFYSVCVEVFIIPLFFIVVALLFLMRNPLRYRDMILVGICH